MSSRNSLAQGMPRLSYEVERWLYILALLALGSLLAFLYLSQAGYVARQTEEMEALENRLRELKQDNSMLLLRIAQYERMSRIKQEAKSMGLGEPQHIEYIEVVLDEPVSPLESDVEHKSQPFSLLVSPHSPWWWSSVVRQFRKWISESGVRADLLSDVSSE